MAGGFRLNEPAIDLALVMAIISSYKDIPIPEKTVVFGEVGLSGEIRAVSMAQQRVQEAKKLGFLRILLPQSSMEQVRQITGIELAGAASVRDAMQLICGR